MANQSLPKYHLRSKLCPTCGKEYQTRKEAQLACSRACHARAIRPLMLFGQLTVVKRIGISKHKDPKWLCRCSCGNDKVATANRLRQQLTVSCGCSWRKHGMSQTPIYRIWQSMRSRCNNPKDPHFPRWGGRGITVCDEWEKSFEAFFRDMGHRPSGRTLDRVNNDLGYSKSNCRWATPQEQQNNQRANVLITFDGRTKTVTEWARFLGLTSIELFRRRLASGFSFLDAATKPKCVKGDSHHATKLSTEQVLQIRHAQTRGRKGVDLAKEYGVSKYVISSILTRKTWAHI